MESYTDININEYIDRYIETLKEDCKQAREAKPIAKYVLKYRIEKGKDYEKLLEGDKKFKKNKLFIYSLKLANPESYSESDLSNIRKKLKQIKKHQKEPKYSYPKVNNDPSPILYVGSSADLNTRIEQHLTRSDRKTYGLHLNQWFDGEVELTVWEFEVSKSVLQIIEDAYSHELKPMFGKTGGNNK